MEKIGKMYKSSSGSATTTTYDENAVLAYILGASTNSKYDKGWKKRYSK